MYAPLFRGRLLACLLLALFVLSCGGSNGETAANSAAESPSPAPAATGAVTASAAAEITVRSVPPDATGPGLRPGFGSHLVEVGPAAKSNGKLWVFLPGTGGRPNNTSMIVLRAAELGFHSIGLAYVNDQAVNDVCPGKEATCHEDMRREIITGADTSPYVDVNVDNAVVGRLTSLLSYLDGQYPDEGWGQFLKDGSPRWDLVTVGGHSQGADHAAFIGKLFGVDRVVMFSGTEPASWTAMPGATPPDRYYAIAHTFEDSYGAMTLSWQRLGLPGDVVSVDQGPAAYAGAHKLSTSRTDCRGDPSTNSFYHGCAIVNIHLPLAADGQTSAFQPVWDYLLGVAGEAASH